MRIWLGNDADACPTRVPDYRNTCAWLTHQQPQQVVAANGVAHDSGVVAKFANFGRGFVHKRPSPSGVAHANRTRSKQRVVRAASKQRHHPVVGCLDFVAPNQHVDAGRVAATHFHAINSGERLLNSEICVACTGGCVGACQVEHHVGIVYAVVTQRPRGIAQRNQLVASTLYFCRWQTGRILECLFCCEGNAL